MKNLPEKDFWKAIKDRLENYSEDPDEDWNVIAGAIPVGKKDTNYFSTASDMFAVVVLAFVLGFQFAFLQNNGSQVQTMQTASTDKPVLRNDIKPLGNSIKREKPEQRAALQRNQVMQNEGDKIKDGNKIRVARQLQTPVAVEEFEKQKNIDEGGDVIPASGNSEVVKAGTPTDFSSEIKIDSVASLIVMKVKPDSAASVTMPVKKEVEKRKKKFRPSVYVLLTPSLAYQKIIPVKNDGIDIREMKSPGIVSAERFGLNVDAGFQMQVSNKLELYSSLSYYQQNQTIAYSYASADEMSIAPASDELSFDLSPGVKTTSFDYSMRNVGAAAGALYFLKGSKMMHKIGGGLYFQKGFLDKRADGHYSNASSTYFGYQLLYRMEYLMTENFSVFIQPSFTHSLLAKEKLSEPFSIKPYRAGLGFGILYHFKKRNKHV